MTDHDGLDPDEIRRACDRFLAPHAGPDRLPRRVLAAILEDLDDRVEEDRYGEGGLIEDFESEVAELLGTEAAAFFPSGTMAQQIALRVWTDRTGVPVVVMHPTSHLELHEARGFEHLHGLRSVTVGTWLTPLTREGLDAIAEPVGALLLELPQRELGGHLPTFDELEAQVAWARDRGVPVHVDGARLWECGPFYDRSPAELASPADSVYVSFYKILAGIAGAALAGPADVVDEARVWRRRHGGTLVAMYPYVLAARRGLADHLPRVADYVAHAGAIADALRDVDGVSSSPDPPPTNMMKVFLRGDPEALGRAVLEVACDRKIWIGRTIAPAQVPGWGWHELACGDSTLEVEPSEVADLYREVVERAAVQAS